MTKLSQTQPDPDFYLQVEDFIISAASVDINGDPALNNEIGMFLLSLLYQHKKQEME